MIREIALLAAATSLGCGSAHRLVAPLFYPPGRGGPQATHDDLGAPPAIAPPEPARCVEWKKATLANGVPLFVAERHAHPSVAVRVVFTAGDAESGPPSASARRLALLAATYLRPLDLGGTVSARCQLASCAIMQQVNAGEGATALASIAAWITRAQPDEAGAARRFEAALDAIRRGEDDPTQSLWRNAEVMALGRPTGWRPSDWMATTMADLQQVRSQLLTPARATVVVAGDVTFAEAKAMAENAFGGWHAPASPPEDARTSKLETAPFAPRVAYVPNNRTDAPLTVVVIHGPPAKSPDAWAYRVALDILGGGLESELFVHLREDLTAAYSPGASVRWLAHESIALLGGPVAPQSVVAATRVIVSTVRELRDKGPDPLALQRAKSRLEGLLEGREGTQGSTAASVDERDGEVRPLSPCSEAPRLSAVTADDVRAAMRRYFAEAELGVVIVAADTQLEAWPEELGLGRVQRRDWLGDDLP